MDKEKEIYDFGDWDQDIHEIHQSYMRKVMMSCCVATVRSTPPGMTAQQYAVMLQEQYRSQNKDVTSRSESVLVKQREELFNELLSIPAEFVPENLDAINVFTQEEEDLLNGEDQEIAPLENSFLAVNQENMNFIHAMIQIHTLTNSKSSIPVEKYRSLLTNFSKTSQQEDSGLGESLESQSSSILSGDVSFVLRAKKSDAMLLRAVDIVLASLTNLIRVPSSGLAIWTKNSMLDSTLQEIVSLVDSVTQENAINNCRNRCSAFVMEIFESILLDRELNTSSLQFLRCKVISELSKSKFLCLDAIGNIIDLIEAFSNNLKSTDSVDITVHPADIENTFYLYKILKELLIRYKSTKSTPVSKKCSRNEPENVLELWKRDLRKVVPEVDPEERWREVLEAITPLCMTHQPLLTIVNYECQTLLKV